MSAFCVRWDWMTKTVQSSNAWLIHQYPVRDNLYLVYFLTPDKLLKGFYRAPKRMIKPQAFCPYWISWTTRLGTHNIQTIELHGQPFVFKDLKLLVGLYLNELIFHLCRTDDIQTHIYDIYEAILHDDNASPEWLMRHFEWQLLADCGYQIDFLSTHQHEAIQKDKYYQFSPEEGFSEAMDGYLGAWLLQIANQEWHEQSLKNFKKILRQTIDHVLNGKILNSRQLLREWWLHQR